LNSTLPTDPFARLWRRLAVWKSWHASFYLGGLGCAALSSTLVLATPPRPFPPAFAPAPEVAPPATTNSVAPPATTNSAPPPPAATNQQSPAATLIPTNISEGPDLLSPNAAPNSSPVQAAAKIGPPVAAPNPPTAGAGANPTPPAAAPLPPPTRAVPNVLPLKELPREGAKMAPAVLTRDDAVRYSLQYNTEIAAIREQHGIAAANIVIANTYPFNPTSESRVRWVSGPESAGITGRVDLEQTLLLELELRGQQGFRKEEAAAGLSRTDNEIVFQELSLAVRTGRAYDTLLYREEKAALADEAVTLTKEAVGQVSRLKDAGKLKAPDLIIIQTELNDFIAQASMAHAAIPPAETDLRRALGVIDVLKIHDTLEAPTLHLDAKALVNLALARRPDRLARESALAEAEARLKLENANRYGNLSVGPNYAYDYSRANMMGGVISMPIPILNQHNGEIQQRQAERARAALELRDSEVAIEHDVEGALARLEAARKWADLYRTKILPELKSAVADIEKLFTGGDTGVDVLRVIDVHRKLLRARDGYLDALWELREAQADLAAALGDPALLAPSLRGVCSAPSPQP
jgi:outer membrane protein TolC